MKPSKQVKQMRKQWIGKRVTCFIRNIRNEREGPHHGTVKGLTTNQAALEDEDGDEYDATGLLVDIPELGHHCIFGEWPVRFSDATLL